MVKLPLLVSNRTWGWAGAAGAFSGSAPEADPTTASRHARQARLRFMQGSPWVSIQGRMVARSRQDDRSGCRAAAGGPGSRGRRVAPAGERQGPAGGSGPAARGGGAAGGRLRRGGGGGPRPRAGARPVVARRWRRAGTGGGHPRRGGRISRPVAPSAGPRPAAGASRPARGAGNVGGRGVS